VRFWDSSGLVAVAARDQHFERAIPLLREDPEVAVWWATRVECVSGLQRRRRAGALDASVELAATERLNALAEGWLEVQPSSEIRLVAEGLLRHNALGAADALQLAAALEWAGERRSGVELVTFDRQLAHAARLEGFTVLPAAVS
jgi:predicted nucleic acid-binding protein